MALLTAKSWLILLPPKVGSQWIVAALRAAGIAFEEVGARHAIRSDLPGAYAGVAAFVRHPADWHASYWAYRSSERSNWDPAWTLDAWCASAHWDEYIEAATTRCAGYVSRMFADYTTPEQGETVIVGKQEHLRADLIRLLEAMGEAFDHDVISRLEPLNNSPNKPWISDQQRLAIYQSERSGFDRYGYNL